MKEVTITFLLTEDVTPDLFAQKIECRLGSIPAPLGFEQQILGRVPQLA